MAVGVGIGLDISEDQIRVVQLRRTGRGIQLQALGALAPPSGALSGGVVHDARLLAEGLRRLFRESRITGSYPRVVVGLPGRVAASRVLELPSMSPDELRAVVAGEMEHYRMIPAGQGTFDFVTLGQAATSNSQVRLLLMAADSRIVDGYREALRQAGVHMAALEPVALAACRAAFPSVKSGGVALILVGARTSDLAIFSNGVLRYCRQMDTGLLDLVAGSQSSSLDLPETEERVEAPPEEVVSLPSLGGVAGGDLQSLVYELQRSLDFYHREAPAAERVERVVLAADTGRLRGLERYLELNLGLPVALCRPFEGVGHSDARLNPEQFSRDESAYAAAVGLALRAIEEVPQAPRMDLSDTGPESRLAKVAPRWLTWALGVSIVLVVLSSLTWFVVGQAVQKRQQMLSASKAELARVTQIESERTSAARRAREAQAIVQLRGLPWSDILLEVSAFMPKGAWLTNLGTSSGNVLQLEGLALSADSVATLMDSLIRSPLFSRPRLAYVQKETVGRRPLVKYQIQVVVSQSPAGSDTPERVPSPVAGGQQ